MRFRKTVVKAVVEIDDFRKSRNADFTTAYLAFLAKTRIHFYQRLQAAYICLDWMYYAENADRGVIPRVLQMWRERIAAVGLSASVPIPDDRKMREALSRPSRTDSELWEAQGHEHRADALSLLERIYAVHGQITES